MRVNNISDGLLEVASHGFLVFMKEGGAIKQATRCENAYWLSILDLDNCQ